MLRPLRSVLHLILIKIARVPMFLKRTQAFNTGAHSLKSKHFLICLLPTLYIKRRELYMYITKKRSKATSLPRDNVHYQRNLPILLQALSKLLSCTSPDPDRTSVTWIHTPDPLEKLIIHLPLNSLNLLDQHRGNMSIDSTWDPLSLLRQPYLWQPNAMPREQKTFKEKVS